MWHHILMFYIDPIWYEYRPSHAVAMLHYFKTMYLEGCFWFCQNSSCHKFLLEFLSQFVNHKLLVMILIAIQSCNTL